MTLTDDIPYNPFHRLGNAFEEARDTFENIGGITQSAGWCAPLSAFTAAAAAPRSPSRARRRTRHHVWQATDRASRTGDVGRNHKIF